MTSKKGAFSFAALGPASPKDNDEDVPQNQHPFDPNRKRNPGPSFRPGRRPTPALGFNIKMMFGQDDDDDDDDDDSDGEGLLMRGSMDAVAGDSSSNASLTSFSSSNASQSSVPSSNIKSLSKSAAKKSNPPFSSSSSGRQHQQRQQQDGQRQELHQGQGQEEEQQQELRQDGQRQELQRQEEEQQQELRRPVGVRLLGKTGSTGSHSRPPVPPSSSQDKKTSLSFSSSNTTASTFSSSSSTQLQKKNPPLRRKATAIGGSGKDKRIRNCHSQNPFIAAPTGPPSVAHASGQGGAGEGHGSDEDAVVMMEVLPDASASWPSSAAEPSLGADGDEGEMYAAALRPSAVTTPPSHIDTMAYGKAMQEEEEQDVQSHQKEDRQVQQQLEGEENGNDVGDSDGEEETEGAPDDKAFAAKFTTLEEKQEALGAGMQKFEPSQVAQLMAQADAEKRLLQCREYVALSIELKNLLEGVEVIKASFTSAA